MTDDYTDRIPWRKKYNWGEILDDYLEARIDQEGLEIDKEELDSYPEPLPTSENEFFLAKKRLDEEIEEILGVEA